MNNKQHWGKKNMKTIHFGNAEKKGRKDWLLYRPEKKMNITYI